MVSFQHVQPCTDGPQRYTLASNNKVEVVGQTAPIMEFQNGVRGRVDLKVLEGLKRPLLSISKMCKARYEISHSSKVSTAIDTKTGHAFKIYERSGIYVMPVWGQEVFLGQGRA